MMRRFVMISCRDFVAKEPRCVCARDANLLDILGIFFAILQCSKQHVLLCPQFESLGHCPRGKQCHLTHRKKRKEKKTISKKDPTTKCEYLLSHRHNHPLFLRIDLPSAALLPNVMPAYIPLNQGARLKR